MSRIFHYIYAHLFGYFWLPCPLCGRMTGGHEWTNPKASIYLGEGRGEGVCNNPKCIAEAMRLSAVRHKLEELSRGSKQPQNR